MKPSADSTLPPDLLAEVTAVLTAHKELAHELTILAGISAEQAKADTAETWEAVLARKERLLTEIVRCDVGRLAQRTQDVQAALAEGHSEIVERLSHVLHVNRQRFTALLATEKQAQHRLQAQLTTLRQKLHSTARRHQARTAYRQISVGCTCDTRFIDSKP